MSGVGSSPSVLEPDPALSEVRHSHVGMTVGNQFGPKQVGFSHHSLSSVILSAISPRGDHGNGKAQTEQEKRRECVSIVGSRKLRGERRSC